MKAWIDSRLSDNSNVVLRGLCKVFLGGGVVEEVVELVVLDVVLDVVLEVVGDDVLEVVLDVVLEVVGDEVLEVVLDVVLEVVGDEVLEVMLVSEYDLNVVSDGLPRAEVAGKTFDSFALIERLWDSKGIGFESG